MPFFGELYLRSTLPFLSEARSTEEADYLAKNLGVGRGQPVLDLGCGHGRHASKLASRGWDVLGFELDPLSLSQRKPGFAAVRGDLFSLPFRSGSIHAAYAWYSTLTTFEDEQIAHLFRQVARVLRPGGRFILHTVPHERLAESPTASVDTVLPDGAHLVETSQFDARTGRDLGHRVLTLPDGRILSGSYFIRYYPLPELQALLAETGFTVAWVHGGPDGTPPTASSTELIVGTERRHG